MPGTVHHVFTNAIPDGTNTNIVRPADWNSSHAFTYAAVGSEISGAFSNLNGISFGTEAGGGLTASYTVPVTTAALTTQNAQQVSAANGSYTFTNLSFSNANGVSFGTSAGSAITASHNALTTAMASNRGSDFVAASAAFAGTSASGTIASNGISVSIGPYITTGMLSNAATISNIKVSAGTLSANRSDITFSNANGVSFGLETNGVVTGSIAGAIVNSIFQGGVSTGGNTAGTTGMASLRLAFVGGSNISLSQSLDLLANSGTITINGGGGGNVNFSAGTTSSALDSVVFSNSNGVSFGLNGSTITASVAAAAKTLTQFMLNNWHSGSLANSLNAQSVYFNYFFIHDVLSFSGLQIVKSFSAAAPGATSEASTGTARFTMTDGVTLFTRVAADISSSQLSSYLTLSGGFTAGLSYSGTSQSFAMSWVTNSAGGTKSFGVTSSDSGWDRFITGRRSLFLPYAGTINSGEYFICFANKSTSATTQSNIAILSASYLCFSNQSLSFLPLGEASSDSFRRMLGGGWFAPDGGFGNPASSLLTASTTTIAQSIIPINPAYTAIVAQFIARSLF